MSDARPRKRSASSAAAKPEKKVRRTPSSKFLRQTMPSRETGYVDLAVSNYALDTTGSVTLIATIAQGTSVNQRVGKKVMIKSIQCRGQAYAGTTATLNDVAYLIVYDRRPTGSVPAVTDILVSAAANSMNNDANSGRFRILKRMDFRLVGNSTTPTVGEVSADADFYLPVNKLCVFKAAGTGAIADIEEGAIYLVTVGNQAAGNAAAILSVAFRTRFLDI